MVVNPKRVRTINPGLGVDSSGPIVYWMNRDQRLLDNWALLYAQQLALQIGAPLVVLFCIDDTPLRFTSREFSFMVTGLAEVEQRCTEYNIRFELLVGKPSKSILSFLTLQGAQCLVTDFLPLVHSQNLLHDVTNQCGLPVYVVDAHNIVPCWEASNKVEFGAYTLRPKILRHLPEYLTEFPSVEQMPSSVVDRPTIDWSNVYRSVPVDASVQPISWCVAGEHEANTALERFKERIETYADRNNPNLNGQSNLSPYLHFGQISAQRVALAVKDIVDPVHQIHSESYLEELIVRKELSDNFTYHNPNYTAFEGFPSWAQKTLNDHRNDVREFVYDLACWENSTTHDALWNAAQLQLVKTGKMHGYMRMYWAKKLLEWSASPDEAMAVGIFLNDKYSIDGRDPNGYAGIAWSIGGVHDRAWAERAVYGKIRYMNANGCARKFDVNTYIATYDSK